MPHTTLAIDFGSKNIGVALVHNHDDGNNEPLFAGTMIYDQVQLKKKLNPRPQLRRIRRTRKTKRRRMRRLEAGLLSVGLDQETVGSLVRFCRRRGYKSLFDEKPLARKRGKDSEKEVLIRFSREEFFAVLKELLSQIVPPGKQAETLQVCESILNREGDRYKEERLIRIDNRGVSRCAWSGCTSVTPRRDNALRDALAQFVYLVVDPARLREDRQLRERLEQALTNAADLAKRLRKAAGQDPNHERKVLRKRIREELKPVQELYPGEAWPQISRNIMNLLETSRGRNRYCREHSAEFVRHTLAGKAIPFKASLTERDIRSRREEVIYQKLWRYIEARLLPLAPEGIDRLVVERVAFDLLAGTFKQRQKIGDKALEEMYQLGPRAGFQNDLKMLKAEFGGRCAYCGQKRPEILEREHMLPHAFFLFDSYLNKVPACPDCNRLRKTSGTPSAANLRIAPEAYEAYEGYLRDKYKTKPPHQFQTIKKGILKLMTDPKRTWEAEQYLALMAKNFLEVTATQRGPRPLARFLAERLRQHYGQPPEVAFRSGRHTELWRRAAYPDFDKYRDKAEGGTINHALDALILASDLPSPTALEGLNLRPPDMRSWASSVAGRAPKANDEGLPEMPEPGFAVPGFEEVLPGNFVQTDLAFMNWNRKDVGILSQDIYGWCEREGKPTKRETAPALAAALREVDKKQEPKARRAAAKKIIENIAHPQLRAALAGAAVGDEPGQAAAQAMIGWFRRSLRRSLKSSPFSSHPADQHRKGMLEDFVQGRDDSIPVTVGVNMRKDGIGKKLDLERVDRRGRLVHRYIVTTPNQGVIVAYQSRNGEPVRAKPLILDWRQSGEVVPQWARAPEVPEGPLKGRRLGEAAPASEVWWACLRKYLRACGAEEYAVLTQGCVVLYDHGGRRFIRNFATDQGFKKKLLCGIVAVQGSPFADEVLVNRNIG